MPNSAEVTTNIRPIEVKSYIANIEESVTPFKNAYMKYKIPTTVGDNFLNNKLKTNTAISSIIATKANPPDSASLKHNPLEYVYHATIAVPNNPKNIQKNVFVKNLLSVFSPIISSFLKVVN